jgi:hypothetical protein
MTLLEAALQSNFVPHLPPVIDTTKSINEQQRKNLSRAFSAFALSNICEIEPVEAAAAVVDDFDDFGIDAIYYRAPSDTLYLCQGKLKSAEQFSQDEALSFCQGARKLIKQDFTGFNNNVQKRQTEIEDALDNCSHIQLVVAHVGSGISKHAEAAVKELLSDDDLGEDRLVGTLFDYDATQVVADLQERHAYKRVDAVLWIQKCSKVAEPRLTYFGLIKLTDLIDLHETHGKALYERNIRTFLGQKTEVNASIRQSLDSQPQDFVYLNNGVTALCQELEPNSEKKSRRKIKVRGFSVINGAQTIATSARFAAENNQKDITAARVLITLIKAPSDGEFGKSVTKARNHQNPVLLSNFAALDDAQERLRRELANLGIHYAYKAEAPDSLADASRIRIDEAAQALALLQPDPRFVVWLKKEPAQLLDTDAAPYKQLFNPQLTAVHLLNAVRFLRYVQIRMVNEALAATGVPRLTCKHGNFAQGWVLAKRLKQAITGGSLIDPTKLPAALSQPFDDLRQTLLTNTQAATVGKGVLALFRNQTDTVPLLQTTMIEHFGLAADPVVEHKKNQQKAGQPYPEELFAYLAVKAPQVGNLT